MYNMRRLDGRIINMDNINVKFLSNFMNAFYKSKDDAKSIYLAGPWFTDEQMEGYKTFMAWTDKWKRARKLKYNVFFPYLFRGTPDECFLADIMAIDASDILLAWLDYKDCGTSFEMGYAKAKGKKLIVLVKDQQSLLKSKTNLMLAKSAEGVLFLKYLPLFLAGEDKITTMPELNWEVLE